MRVVLLILSSLSLLVTAQFDPRCKDPANTTSWFQLRGDVCQCDWNCIDCHGGSVVELPMVVVGTLGEHGCASCPSGRTGLDCRQCELGNPSTCAEPSQVCWSNVMTGNVPRKTYTCSGTLQSAGVISGTAVFDVDLDAQRIEISSYEQPSGTPLAFHCVLQGCTGAPLASGQAFQCTEASCSTTAIMSALAAPIINNVAGNTVLHFEASGDATLVQANIPFVLPLASCVARGCVDSPTCCCLGSAAAPEDVCVDGVDVNLCLNLLGGNCVAPPAPQTCCCLNPNPLPGDNCLPDITVTQCTSGLGGTCVAAPTPLPSSAQPTRVPTAATLAPTGAPTALTGAPTTITGGPTAVTGAPTAVTGAPTAVTGAPTAVTGAPTTMTGAPTPTIITGAPTAVPTTVITSAPTIPTSAAPTVAINIPIGFFSGNLNYRLPQQVSAPFSAPCCNDVLSVPTTLVSTQDTIAFYPQNVSNTCGSSGTDFFLLQAPAPVAGVPNCYSGMMSIDRNGEGLVPLGLSHVYWDGAQARVAVNGGGAVTDCNFPNLPPTGNYECQGSGQSFINPAQGDFGLLTSPPTTDPAGTLTPTTIAATAVPTLGPDTCCCNVRTRYVAMMEDLGAPRMRRQCIPLSRAECILIGSCEGDTPAPTVSPTPTPGLCCCKTGTAPCQPGVSIEQCRLDGGMCEMTLTPTSSPTTAPTQPPVTGTEDVTITFASPLNELQVLIATQVLADFIQVGTEQASASPASGDMITFTVPAKSTNPAVYDLILATGVLADALPTVIAVSYNRTPTTARPSTTAPTTEAPTMGGIIPTTDVPSSPQPTTDSPTSHAPTSHAPTSFAPTTDAPTSRAPTQDTLAGGTFAPTSLAPTTDAPTTLAPTSHAPTAAQTPPTGAPSSAAPSSSSPTSAVPTSHAPTSLTPTSHAPTSLAPTTDAPTSLAPTQDTVVGGTYAPTSFAPTTDAPTTLAPTSHAPTSLAPTSHAPTPGVPTLPTTIAPTTEAPTTEVPTTESPTAVEPTTDAPSMAPTPPLTTAMPTGVPAMDRVYSRFFVGQTTTYLGASDCSIQPIETQEGDCQISSVFSRTTAFACSDDGKTAFVLSNVGINSCESLSLDLQNGPGFLDASTLGTCIALPLGCTTDCAASFLPRCIPRVTDAPTTDAPTTTQAPTTTGAPTTTQAPTTTTGAPTTTTGAPTTTMAPTSQSPTSSPTVFTVNGTTAPPPTAAPTLPVRSVYELLGELSVFSTLRSFVDTSLPVISVLNTPTENVTLFAPNNMALTGISTFSESQMQLHIATGILTRDLLGNEESLDTEAGPSLLRINRYTGPTFNDVMTVNGVPIVMDQVLAINGVIHSIEDKPLLAPIGTITDVISSRDDLTMLASLIQAMTQADRAALNSDGRTFFAPSDEAFENVVSLLASAGLSLDQLKGSPSILKKLLFFHQLDSTVYNVALREGDITVNTEDNDSQLGISSQSTGFVFPRVTLTDAVGLMSTVVVFDLPATNGVVHIVNKVLIPPGFLPEVPTVPPSSAAPMLGISVLTLFLVLFLIK